jgi:hypothetical protein
VNEDKVQRAIIATMTIVLLVLVAFWLVQTARGKMPPSIENPFHGGKKDKDDFPPFP